jgi:hypothetical protein
MVTSLQVIIAVLYVLGGIQGAESFNNWYRDGEGMEPVWTQKVFAFILWPVASVCTIAGFIWYSMWGE